MAQTTTYNFGNITFAQIIDDAFERCGLNPSMLETQHIVSARRSLNLLYSDWVNKGCNLWTVVQNMFSLVPGQAAYQMPYNMVDVAGNEMIVTNATRVLGGTAYSSAGGNANNCFDGLTSTACTQTTPNGYISYDYGIGNNQPINYVGIQTNINTNYTLTIEYTLDGSTWLTALSIPLQAYVVGAVSWFVIPSPIAAQTFRIRETGGATLNINEIYFNVPQYGSRRISRISREEYIAISNKTVQAATGSFIIDRTIQAQQLTLFGNPNTYQSTGTIFLYPCPDSTWQFIVYNMVQYIKDVNDLHGTNFVPQRWLEPSIAGLASKLALKFAADKYLMLKDEAEQAYRVAAVEDKERVPLRIEPWDYLT